MVGHEVRHGFVGERPGRQDRPSELPLQQRQLGVDGRLLDVERGQGCGLAGLNGGDAVDGGAPVDADGVPLDEA